MRWLLQVLFPVSEHNVGFEASRLAEQEGLVAGRPGFQPILVIPVGAPGAVGDHVQRALGIVVAVQRGEELGVRWVEVPRVRPRGRDAMGAVVELPVVWRSDLQAWTAPGLEALVDGTWALRPEEPLRPGSNLRVGRRVVAVEVA